MPIVNIKALSINEAYRNKKKKTVKYLKYTKDMSLILPVYQVPENCDLRAIYELGVSSNASDVDNMIKPLQDQLQKKYGFNDNRIVEFTARKVKVKKGFEFIKFEITSNE